MKLNRIEIELFPVELLQIALCYESVTFEDIIDEISINFDSSIKSKLKHLLLELDQSSVTLIKNYCVQINLKYTSTYAYAPRKFTWAECKQTREITDDLLSCGIIKTSPLTLLCAYRASSQKKWDHASMY